MAFDGSLSQTDGSLDQRAGGDFSDALRGLVWGFIGYRCGGGREWSWMVCGWWRSMIVRWSGCGIRCRGDDVRCIPSGSGSCCGDVCRFGGIG